MPAPVLETVMRLAARHHVEGRLKDAAALYRRVLQSEPQSAEALRALGVMAQQTDRPDAAEKLLQRAIDSEPNWAPAHNDLGSLYMTQSRHGDALAQYRRALECDPSYAPAHAHHGAVLAKMGKLEEAVAAYQRAVELGMSPQRGGVAIEIQPVGQQSAIAPHFPLDASDDLFSSENESGAATGTFTTAQPSGMLALAVTAPVVGPIFVERPGGVLRKLALSHGRVRFGGPWDIRAERADWSAAATKVEVAVDAWVANLAVETALAPNPTQVLMPPVDGADDRALRPAVLAEEEPHDGSSNGAFAALSGAMAENTEHGVPTELALIEATAGSPINAAPSVVGTPLQLPRGVDTSGAQSPLPPVSDPIDAAEIAPDRQWAGAMNRDLELPEDGLAELPAAPPPPATDVQAAELDSSAASGAAPDVVSDESAVTGKHKDDPMLSTRALAKELRRARRTPRAEARQAVALHKEGTDHLRQQRTQEAIAALERLVELHPTSAKVHRDLGAAYLRADRLDDATASLIRALELRPKFADAYASLGDALNLQGKVEEAIACYRRALLLKPSAARTHSNLLLTLNYHRKLDAQAIYAEHLQWAQRHGRPVDANIADHANDPSPDRRIRIGYVSPDFRRHSVNFFVEPILASHDRSAFHVTCYSDVIRPDDETDRIAGLCDRWRDIRGLADEQVAAMVLEDKIDLLVDLAGHTGSNRLGVFARKPAPVQITYLGYPNTTGLPTIDYRLTDAVADPPAQTEQFHTEQLLRLPNFLCYQPAAAAPESVPAPIVKNGFVTFGCFNILAKVTPEALALWAKIMTVVPKSRLVMKDRVGSFASAARRRHVQDIFAFHRVSADRLDLLDKDPDFESHLRAYQRVDVMLDPFPYNGTTTTCESLWMGVPVITLAGNRHAALVGASVLTAAGLPEFIHPTLEAYARAAVLLGRDANRITLLRRTLRPKLAASDLLNSKRFTANLERAFREIWSRWCDLRRSGLPAPGDSLSLSDD